MGLMGLEAIYRKPRTSDAQPDHHVYPYLLRELKIGRLTALWGRLTASWDFQWTPAGLVGSIAHRQAA